MKIEDLTPSNQGQSKDPRTARRHYGQPERFFDGTAFYPGAIMLSG